MKLTFSSEITATDEARRTISGKIAPIGEIGHTSAGKVIFERGSIQVDDPKKVLFLEEHNDKVRLGRAQSIEASEDGWYGTFKLSASTKATDALIEASEGLKTGMSVGVEVIDSRPTNGVIHVLAAKLVEVSLVSNPAFKSAEIKEVAASETEEAKIEETKPTESEAVVENTPDTVAVAPEVETPAVEASAPKVTAAQPRVYTQPRVAPMSGAQYLEANIKAALGDDNARQLVRAADDSTSTNTGLTLPQHLNTFITDTFTGRPAFEAVTRQALIESGMSFTVPRLYTNAGTPNVAPTVADTNEGSAPSETGMTSTYDTVTVEKFSGLNRVSFELIDRSSPAFMELLMVELRKAYEAATDTALIAALSANGTAATTQDADAEGLQGFISVEGAAAYKGTGGDFANKLVASTDVWAAIAGFADTTGRPIYNAASPYNAGGAVGVTANRGTVLGTDLIVDHNIATSGFVDNSCYLIAPSSVYVWESPTTNLRINVLTSGEVEINLYGYLAIYVAKSGKGVRKFNLT